MKPIRSLLFLLCLAICSTHAWAGEDLIGVILVSDGGSVNNATSGYGSAGCATGPAGDRPSPNGAGACAQSFRLPTNAPLSIQCNTAAVIKTNAPQADAGDGVRVAIDQFFTTSTRVQGVNVGVTPDGGTYTGGVVAIAPIAGAASAECKVFGRTGAE